MKIIKYILKKIIFILESIINNLTLQYLLINKNKIRNPNILHSSNNLKIAFIKQDVNDNLYCCSPSNNPKTLLESSLKHSGPIGLFTKFSTDFYIVKTEAEEECNIWKQKCYDCNHATIDKIESFKNTIYKNGERGHTKPQKDFGVSVDNIEWSKYDIVISLDISIPKRITTNYKNIIWAYYITEPCMSSYEQSRKQIISGYDLFLNQKMGYFTLNPKEFNKYTEINFPYDLQYYGCFHETLKIDLNNIKKSIFIETHTYQEMTDEQKKRLSSFGEVKTVTPKSIDIISDLIDSKYFIRFGGRKMWGNSMIEAIACGCLAIGDPDEFINKSLFIKETTVKSYDEIIEKLAYFEANPDAYNKALEKQKILLDYYCFYQPVTNLLKKSQKVRNLTK